MCVILIALLLSDNDTNKRRFWVKRWLRERRKFSHLQLLKVVKRSSKEDFQNYLRMNEQCFKILLNLVKPFITKKNTSMRNAISAEERLIATLRFLATGRSFEDLKFTTLISPQALGKIIPETFKYIYEALKKDYLKVRKSYIVILFYEQRHITSTFLLK